MIQSAFEIAQFYVNPPPMPPPCRKMTEAEVEAVWTTYRDDRHATLRQLAAPFGVSGAALAGKLRHRYGLAYTLVAGRKAIKNCNRHGACLDPPSMIRQAVDAVLQSTRDQRYRPTTR